MQIGVVLYSVPEKDTTMPVLICSGVNRPDQIELLAREGVAGMVNALEACQPKLVEAYARFPDVPLYLDSGAFQGNTNLAGYQRVIERVGERFRWMANLDVIEDAQQSDANYSALVNGLPSNLASKVLWVYQGGSLADLAAHACEHKLVGIGGIVRIIVNEGVDAALTYLRHIGEVVQRAGAQAHGFGIGSPYLLQALGTEEWLCSIDTSKWLIGYRAMELLLASGEYRSATQLGLRLTRAECAANNVRVLKEWANPHRQDQRLLSLWADHRDYPAERVYSLSTL
jgi:hypothetical protein